MATIAENLTRIQSAKTDIRTAIEAKGVTVPSSATIDTYDTYVSQISGGMPMPSKLSSASFNDYGLITSAEIKSGVTSIDYNAFSYCQKLSSCTIPDSVTSIGSGAFDGCGSLTSIDIPNSVTSIGDWAFAYCSFSSIVIPDSVASIGGSAFQNCTGLTSCTIGSGITSIGIGGFSYCNSLTSITIKATTPPTLNSGAFYGSTCPIYVPAASLTAYQTSEDWEDYRTRLQAIS